MRRILFIGFSSLLVLSMVWEQLYGLPAVNEDCQVFRPYANDADTALTGCKKGGQAAVSPR
jgi:hypothetical protein